MNNTSTCANCGKDEDDIKLKSCSACKLVKYCSRDCQIAHRPQHKKECKKRAKELHEERLFEQPPPLEDCPICMVRLPHAHKARMYMNCCGKVICTGCTFAEIKSKAAKRKDNVCPFCRTVARKPEESIKQFKKRMELDDAIAICHMGGYYSEGQYGLQRDHAKALELWHRAAELGHTDAYYNIGDAYKNGRGVERDEKKSKYYYELSAIGGCVEARHILGCSKEADSGNMNRALKHWMIAVKDGDLGSLEKVKRMCNVGFATKDDYAKALQSYQAYVDEIKTVQRDEAAAFTNSVYY